MRRTLTLHLAKLTATPQRSKASSLQPQSHCQHKREIFGSLLTVLFVIIDQVLPPATTPVFIDNPLAVSPPPALLIT